MRSHIGSSSLWHLRQAEALAGAPGHAPATASARVCTAACRCAAAAGAGVRNERSIDQCAYLVSRCRARRDGVDADGAQRVGARVVDPLLGRATFLGCGELVVVLLATLPVAQRSVCEGSAGQGRRNTIHRSCGEVRGS